MTDGALILPKPLPVPASVAASLRSLAKLRVETYRPAWATDEALKAARETLRNLLRPAGWTETAQILDQVAALVPMPATEDGVRGYIERLEEYPLDVLGRSCESVIRSHMSQRPPNVAVFVKAAVEDRLYLRRRQMMANLNRLWRLPEDVRPRPTGEERARILAGFRELNA